MLIQGLRRLNTISEQKFLKKLNFSGNSCRKSYNNCSSPTTQKKDFHFMNIGTNFEFLHTNFANYFEIIFSI